MFSSPSRCVLGKRVLPIVETRQCSVLLELNGAIHKTAWHRLTRVRFLEATGMWRRGSVHPGLFIRNVLLQVNCPYPRQASAIRPSATYFGPCKMGENK